MRIGLLTGGGDCPGLNAVIRAVVRKGIDGYGDQLVGFRDGWRGVLEDVCEELTIESTRGILPRGGTILGSSRTNPFKRDDGVEVVRATLARHELDGLIAIGGEDTLGAANRLGEAGVNVIGVPKTIDNDLGATDVTFGFDTALHVATEAIDRLHTTAESHHRNLVVEVMGRNAGWIALHSGLAGGADVILIPEIPFDIDEVCRPDRAAVTSAGATSRSSSSPRARLPKEGTMSVSAGELDEFGHPRLGGIGQRLEREIEQRTGFETRTTVLGHIQRGGTPTAFDRVLATRLGPGGDRRRPRRPVGDDDRAAVDRDRARARSRDAVAEVRRVPVEEYERYGVLFG